MILDAKHTEKPPLHNSTLLGTELSSNGISPTGEREQGVSVRLSQLCGTCQEKTISPQQY